MERQVIGRQREARWLDLATCFVSTVIFFIHRELDRTERPIHTCIYVVCLYICDCLSGCLPAYSSHFSHVQLFATPWLQPGRLLRPWDSAGEKSGGGCHFLLCISVYIYINFYWREMCIQTGACAVGRQAGNVLKVDAPVNHHLESEREHDQPPERLPSHHNPPPSQRYGDPYLYWHRLVCWSWNL